MNIIKAMGIVTVFAVCSAIGIFFSLSLKSRAKSLKEICISLTSFDNRINHSVNELENILPNAFKNCKFIKFNGAKAEISGCDLKNSDLKTLNDFFKNAGTEDKSAEREKAKFFLGIFESELEKAESEANNKCKLFTVSGICIGLTAAVLFI